MLPAIVKAKGLEILAANLSELSLTMWDLGPTYEYTQLGSCHGPAGGAPAVYKRRGSAGGGVSNERIPRDKPPADLARRGEIVTKAQKLRPALSSHFLVPYRTMCSPLAHFGAISGVCDGGVVRTDHHDAGERSGSTQHYDLKVHHASVGGW
jgi:hypothetical protein